MSWAMRGRPTKLTGKPAAPHAPPMKQPTVPAPRIAILSAATVGGDSLVRQPQAFGRRPRLPEDVDWNPTTRVPIAADAEPFRLHLGDEALTDAHRHILVEAGMIAEGAEEQLEALRFDD